MKRFEVNLIVKGPQLVTFAEHGEPEFTLYKDPDIYCSTYHNIEADNADGAFQEAKSRFLAAHPSGVEILDKIIKYEWDQPDDE